MNIQKIKKEKQNLKNEYSKKETIMQNYFLFKI